MLARGTAIVFAPAEDTRLSPAGAGRGGATRVRRTAVSRGAEVRLARWKCERVVLAGAGRCVERTAATS